MKKADVVSLAESVGLEESVTTFLLYHAITMADHI